MWFLSCHCGSQCKNCQEWQELAMASCESQGAQHSEADRRLTTHIGPIAFSALCRRMIRRTLGSRWEATLSGLWRMNENEATLDSEIRSLQLRLLQAFRQAASSLGSVLLSARRSRMFRAVCQRTDQTGQATSPRTPPVP